MRNVANGNVPIDRKPRLCLNQNRRVQPAGQLKSRYPTWCPYNPFTLGSVMGIADGWGVPVQTKPMRLRQGEYDVTARIGASYAEALGLSTEAASITFRLVVERGGAAHSATDVSAPARR
jgi:hypothetical protein